MKTKITFVLVMTALLTVILVQNTQVVTFRIYFWTISISQIILVPLAVAMGFLLGYVVGSSKRKRRTVRR